MKNTFVFVFISLFVSSSIFAQELLGGHGAGTGISSGLISTTPVVLNERVEGTPYINEKFVPATISASENVIFYVRYNAVNDQIEVKGEDDKAYALNKHRRDIVIQLIANKKTYQSFIYFDSDNNQSFGYFVNLNDRASKVKLLKKERIKFLDEKPQVTGYDTPQPAKYQRLSDQYFMKVDDKNAVIIPSKKKSFAKLFPKYEDDILSFIKSEKLRLKREEDLSKLISFINTLG